LLHQGAFAFRSVGVTSTARSKTISCRKRYVRDTSQTYSRSRGTLPRVRHFYNRGTHFYSTAREITETTKLFKKNEKLLIQKLSKQYELSEYSRQTNWGCFPFSNTYRHKHRSIFLGVQ